jgi:hypothetical protein
MKKRWYSLLVLLLCVGLSLSAQAWSKDEAEIRGLIEKFSLMWTAEDGIAIFNQISATDNFMHITPQGPNNKVTFLVWFAGVKANNPVVKHTHQVQKIIITNKVAYEFGTVEITMKNGAVSKGEVLNMFFKEPTGWRLLMSIPGKPIMDVLAQ